MKGPENRIVSLVNLRTDKITDYNEKHPAP